MKTRSRSVTALAFSSVMIGLYCQFAAVALIVAGSVFSSDSSAYTAISFVHGAIFAGLTFASYFLAYGFWTHKGWSWAGGIALFVTLAVANVSLSVVSTNFTSMVLPLAAAVAGVWYLSRPAVKAELLGAEAPAAAPSPATDPLKVAEPAS